MEKSSHEMLKKQAKEVIKSMKDVAVKIKRPADTLSEQVQKKRVILSNITNSRVQTRPRTRSAKSSQASCGEDSSLKTGINDLSQKKDSTVITVQAPNISVEVPNVSNEASGSRTVVDDSALSDDDEPPPGVVDFDKENENDPNSEAYHAKYVFRYYRKREAQFVVEKYLPLQAEITSNMRAVLVDWMVEVQENFELNHETLYLAVKLVDMYLMKRLTSKRNLQLVAATAILIAAKYDERMPPLVDDFIYICDDCYKRHELVAMEVKMLSCVKFDLGIPLSYRFLRRYARCNHLSMEMLTLARFILETSLMDYDIIDVTDSKLAAAALFLALKMKKMDDWNPTLQYYSGYKAEELTDLVKHLNRLIANPPFRNLKNICIKYSHELFFEVAKVPPLPLED